MHAVADGGGRPRARTPSRAWAASPTTQITALLRRLRRAARRRRGLVAAIAAANAADVAERQGRAAARPRAWSPTQTMRARHDRRPARLARRPPPARPGGRDASSTTAGRVEQLTRAAGRGRLRVRGPAQRVRRRHRRAAHAATPWCSASARDALGTARAIVEHALDPALRGGGPARGRGLAGRERRARRRLGAVLRPAAGPGRGARLGRGGGPAGRGGAPGRRAGQPARDRRRLAGRRRDADAARFAAVVEHSLDRKVCNTLNVCCIVARARRRPGPGVPRRPGRAGERRGHGCKLHVVEGDERVAARGLARAADPGPPRRGRRRRAPGRDLAAKPSSAANGSGRRRPRSRLKMVDDVDEAVALFNRYSPQFVATPDLARTPAAHAALLRARSTPPSSATASPAGSTASTPWTGPSSACPTGSTAACSPAAACCPATACSPSAPGSARPTPADPPARGPAADVDGLADRAASGCPPPVALGSLRPRSSTRLHCGRHARGPLGGSFNPAHEGHAHVAETALAAAAAWTG